MGNLSWYLVGIDWTLRGSHREVLWQHAICAELLLRDFFLYAVIGENVNFTLPEGFVVASVAANYGSLCFRSRKSCCESLCCMVIQVNAAKGLAVSRIQTNLYNLLLRASRLVNFCVAIERDDCYRTCAYVLCIFCLPYSILEVEAEISVTLLFHWEDFLTSKR